MTDLKLELYAWCFVAGLLGILFHIVAIKIPSMKKRAKVANEPFDFRVYLKDDAAAIAASVVTVLILLVTLDEVLNFKPAIQPYLKASFIFVGYTGSSILIAILGTAQAKIDKVVDTKTDIADKKN